MTRRTALVAGAGGSIGHHLVREPRTSPEDGLARTYRGIAAQLGRG
jgi:hypothetical protein